MIEVIEVYTVLDTQKGFPVYHNMYTLVVLIAVVTFTGQSHGIAFEFSASNRPYYKTYNYPIHMT